MAATRILRIGHRGAAGHAPENTLTAIQKAIALGCDFAEVDVRRTRDGELILLHDERVDRTTDGEGPVDGMSIERVRKLKGMGGERIPTLAQALHAANGRIGLMLELKVQGITDKVRSAVRRSRFRSPLVYASFAAEEMREIRTAIPSATTMVLMDTLPRDPITHVRHVRATHAGLRFSTVTRPLIEGFHDAGLRVFVYTVNEPKDIRSAVSVGVDSIISDFPDRI